MSKSEEKSNVQVISQKQKENVDQDQNKGTASIDKPQVKDESLSKGKSEADNRSESMKSTPPQSAPTQNSSKKLILFACSCVGLIALGILCAVVALFLLKSGDSGNISSQPFAISTGSPVLAGSSPVGVDGGQFKIEDPESPLNGLQILIAPGLVETEEQIAVSFKPVVDIKIPSNLNLLSDIIVLDKADPSILFTHPIAVQVPYDISKAKNNQLVAVYEYHPEDQTIEETTVIDHNAENGTVTFLTTHFSEYIVVELLSTLDEMLQKSLVTGFQASQHGWFITNWGGYLTDRGNCLGMSAMSKYVFSHELSGGGSGSFYERYRQGNPEDELDDFIAQELAARSQLSLTNRWSEFRSDVTRYHDAFGLPQGHSQGSIAQGQSLLMSLVVTGQPQLLFVNQRFTDGSWGAAHAVLVHSYDGEYFHVYDPNYPYRASNPAASDKKIKWSADTGFEIYDSSVNANEPGLKFNVYYHIGSNLFTQNSILSGLWTKAMEGFPDDEFPVIAFTTPVEGSQIGEKSVVVTGTVTGGQYSAEAAQKFLHWYYPNGKGGLDYLRGTVAADGSFSQELPVVPGENWIHVVAAGAQPTNEWAGFARTHFIGTILPSDMIITLSWGTNETDIDLHVTDPTGFHVYYSSPQSTIGAALDIDDTNGYGPEHYTISSEEGDQMPFGDYVVKVVYYADHDGNTDVVQVTPYTVNLKWVKAINPLTQEKMWAEETVTGVLTFDDEEHQVYVIEHREPDLSVYEILPNPFGL